MPHHPILHALRKPRASRTCSCAAGVVAAFARAACGEREPASLRAAGNAEAGRRAIAQLECGVCHVIPGVRGARGTVGPTLAGFARRSYIAGTVPNNPAAALRWVLDPPSMAPATAMPVMPLTVDQARDVVAYLYTLE
jgi:cytochrome c